MLGYYESLTDLGMVYTQSQPLLAILSSHSVSSKAVGIIRKTLVKFTVQRHRLTKNWQPIIGLSGFPYHKTLLKPIYSSSFYTVYHVQLSRKNYKDEDYKAMSYKMFVFPPTKKKKKKKKKPQGIPKKAKNTVWSDKANIRTRHERDVSIMRWGI